MATEKAMMAGLSQVELEALREAEEEGKEEEQKEETQEPTPEPEKEEKAEEKKTKEPEKEEPEEKEEEKPEKEPENAAMQPREEGQKTPEEVAFDGFEQVSMPRLEVKYVENYDNKLKELEEQKKQVMAKYKAGDMQIDEMIEAREKITKEVGVLEAQQRQAKTNDEFNRSAADAEWGKTVDAFFKHARTNYDVDYKKNTSLFAALDAKVRALAQAKENDEKSNAWILVTAHNAVMEDFGAVKKAPKNKEEETAKPEKADMARKPKMDNIPPSLRQVPSAQDNDSDEFADIDKLSGLELEKAIVKMSPDKRARYERV